MKREIITTADGSQTVAIPELGVTYHSHHGAVQESLHVFIEAGLWWWLRQAAVGNTGRATGSTGLATGEVICIADVFASGLTSGPLRIFEMGFGTGLNAWLTALEAEKTGRPIHYTAVEKFPLTPEERAGLQYGPESVPFFKKAHESPWGVPVALTPLFTLEKWQTSLQEFSAAAPFNLIYFDAFAPSAQPELWTEAVFSDLSNMLVPGGVLVTYCSKGTVRRAMQAAGFAVTKIPGPPGKREMVRAVRS